MARVGLVARVPYALVVGVATAGLHCFDDPSKVVANLLGMVVVNRDEAWEIVRRPCPELPGE
jgi:hypothetical protein